MRESIVMPETVASVLCKFMVRNYSWSIFCQGASENLPIRSRNNCDGFEQP
jgi:hypothetical protein